MWTGRRRKRATVVVAAAAAAGVEEIHGDTLPGASGSTFHLAAGCLTWAERAACWASHFSVSRSIPDPPARPPALARARVRSFCLACLMCCPPAASPPPCFLHLSLPPSSRSLLLVRSCLFDSNDAARIIRVLPPVRSTPPPSPSPSLPPSLPLSLPPSLPPSLKIVGNCKHTHTRYTHKVIPRENWAGTRRSTSKSSETTRLSPGAVVCARAYGVA